MSFTEDNQPLFSQSNASAILEGIAIAVEREVDQIAADILRTTTDTDLAAHIVAKHRVQTLHLVEDSLRVISHDEIAISPFGAWWRIGDLFRSADSVRGVRLKVTMRYEGVGNLWRFKPTADWTEEARGNVHEDDDFAGFVEIIFNIAGEPSKEVIRGLIDTEFAKISRGVCAMADITRQWNARLESHALASIAARRRFLDLLIQLPEMIEIPLVVGNGRVMYEPIELRRRAIEVVTVPEDNPHERRYGISETGYESALHVIRHFGRSFEQTPAAVERLPEEQLRDLFLAALSTYFDSPSGERFRRDGKADIVIEEKTQMAFVTECKVWEGINSLDEALTQITELYTTWRDCKCAVLLFNKTRKDMRKIATSINDHLRKHPLTVSADEVAPGEWRLRMKRQDDANNIMTIQIFLFDISMPKLRIP